MDRNRDLEHKGKGGIGATLIPSEAPTPAILSETAPAPCRWPSLAIKEMRMADLDAALTADPLFHLCPDGHEGRVDVRYWYFHPLHLSCRHCSAAGGICVVEPATVICRHRRASRTEQPIPER